MTAALIMKELVKLREGKAWMAHSRQADTQTAMRRYFHGRKRIMDVQEQNERGLKLRVDMFGREAVDKRMNAFGDFGKPLQHIINAYAYGDVWQRPSLSPAVKSLVMVAMMGAAGHNNELRVHLKGALKNGCSTEQIQDVLLLLTMYCGIPAANEAHRIAADVLNEGKR
jgi:4-carboxymuconolactone decarboxylase